MKCYAAPGLTAFYVLNHRLDFDEVRRQLEELKAAGFRGFFMHPRPGLLTPYLSDEWWETIGVIIEHAKKIGLDAWLYDENPYPSGGGGGKVVYDNSEFRARGLHHEAARVAAGEKATLDLPAGRLVRAFALKLSEDIGRPTSDVLSQVPSTQLSFTGEMRDITSSVGWVTESWDNHYRHFHFYYPPYGQMGNPHWRAWTDWPFLRLHWQAPDDGDWLVCGFVERELSFHSFGYYLDFYNPRAADYFLEITHREYARRFGEHFGKTVPGIFTDEPKFMHPTAWSPVLEEQFAARLGYDLRDYLPHLLYSVDASTQVVRHDYRSLSSQMFIESFCKPIYNWAEENDIASTGHISPEEEPLWQSFYTPDLMEWLKWFQIPGVDIIGGHIGDARFPLLNMGPKLVSSVAHQQGKAQVLCESWAVSGWELSLADMKKIVDWLFVLGVNLICAHGQFYSIDGYRKREAAPSQFYQASYWPYFSELSSYIEQTGEALTGGKHLCDIAVLHPQTTIAALMPDREHEAAQLRDDLAHMMFAMLGDSRDFDFVNENTLASAHIEDGALALGDERYKVLVLPSLQFIEAKSAQAIVRFVEGGVKVIALNAVPSHCIASNENGNDGDSTSIEKRLFACQPFDCVTTDNAHLLEVLNATLPRVLRIEGEYSNQVFSLRRENAEGRALVFIFNTRDEAFEGTVHLKEGGAEYSETIALPAHGSRLLYIEEMKKAGMVESPSLQSAKTASRVLDISRDWVLQRAEDNVLLLNTMHVLDASAGGAPPPITNAFRADVCEVYDLPAYLQSATHLWYGALFSVRGEAEKLALMLEEAGVQQPYEIWINDQRAEQPQKNRRYDALNYETDIAALVKSSSEGALNQMTLRVPNLAPAQGNVIRGQSARPVMEAPRLFGDFRVHFPYGGYNTRAELRFGKSEAQAAYPMSWERCGWPHYSGTVRYTKTVSLGEEDAVQLRVLRFSEVRDLVRVTLNGEVLGTRAWAPFEIDVAGKLRAGDNEILLEVANSPINVLEGVAQQSGLLGAIELAG